MNLERMKEVLNDLIKINNDRIQGYERAMAENEFQDQDLNALFLTFIEKSKSCKSELVSMATKLSGETATDTTASGKLYRMWMDIKVAISGNNRLAVLENCEFGEDAAQKAYKEALEDSNDQPADLINLISKQKAELKEDHDKVKGLRDMEKAAS